MPLRPQDKETYQSLCAACNSLNTPALLVLHDSEWPHLLPEIEDFTKVDAIEWDPTHSIEQELNWRMQQLWSRSRTPKPAHKARKERNSWGPYKFLLDSRTVLNRDQAIALSSFEFTLALELIRGIDRILTRDWLMRRLWADKPRMPDPRTLDVYATKVRRKLKLPPREWVRAARRVQARLPTHRPPPGAGRCKRDLGLITRRTFSCCRGTTLMQGFGGAPASRRCR